MGYKSSYTGVIQFNRPLTREEAIEFAILCTYNKPSGCADWTLTEGFAGIMCSWEEAFKGYDAEDGLTHLLKTLPADVKANGLLQRKGESNEDICLWRIKDNVLTKLGATILFDLEAFANAVFEACNTNPNLHVGSAVLATFKDWEEPEPEDGESMDLYDFLQQVEEEEEDIEEDIEDSVEQA